jgi:hypothetical protein
VCFWGRGVFSTRQECKQGREGKGVFGLVFLQQPLQELTCRVGQEKRAQVGEGGGGAQSTSNARDSTATQLGTASLNYKLPNQNGPQNPPSPPPPPPHTMQCLVLWMMQFQMASVQRTDPPAPMSTLNTPNRHPDHTWRPMTCRRTQAPLVVTLTCLRSCWIRFSISASSAYSSSSSSSDMKGMLVCNGAPAQHSIRQDSLFMQSASCIHPPPPPHHHQR